jgi:hypothetical protein
MRLTWTVLLLLKDGYSGNKELATMRRMLKNGVSYLGINFTLQLRSIGIGKLRSWSSTTMRRNVLSSPNVYLDLIELCIRRNCNTLNV